MKLSELARPKRLQHVVGQAHLFGKNSPFMKIARADANLIFYGPSGTGKTTVARILAENSNREFHSFNATECSISDIKKVIARVSGLFSYSGVLIYIDEIQYFNKKQQQNLLSCLEDGRVVLIAATTESPFFSVYRALISRCLVFEFKPVEKAQVCLALKRAVEVFLKHSNSKIDLIESDYVFEKIAVCSCGDVRRAINFLEACMVSAKNGVVDCSVVDEVLSCAGVAGLTKLGSDEFYDLLSALQKSIRGSDENAAIYYLARILNESSMQAVCRRLLVIASEDVGLAFPSAISIVKACVDAAEQIGWPQAKIVLAQATILLAVLPKSNSSYAAINRAVKKAEQTFNVAVPRHLQNLHFDGLGNKKNKSNSKYLYPHDYENNYVDQTYLPDELQGEVFFEFGSSKFEKLLQANLKKLKRKIKF